LTAAAGQSPVDLYHCGSIVAGLTISVSGIAGVVDHSYLAITVAWLTITCLAVIDLTITR
jgi:hypothetical protein